MLVEDTNYTQPHKTESHFNTENSVLVSYIYKWNNSFFFLFAKEGKIMRVENSAHICSFVCLFPLQHFHSLFFIWCVISAEKIAFHFGCVGSISLGGGDSFCYLLSISLSLCRVRFIYRTWNLCFYLSVQKHITILCRDEKFDLSQHHHRHSIPIGLSNVNVVGFLLLLQRKISWTVCILCIFTWKI